MDAWLDETQVAFEEYSDQSLHSGELYGYRFIINVGQHLLIKSLAVMHLSMSSPTGDVREQ